MINFSQYKEEQYLEMAMKGLSDVAFFYESGLIGIFDAKAMKPALEKKDQKSMLKSVLGVISFRRNNTLDANETTGIAAQHGYGPLLCLLLMSKSPNGVVPNRVRSEMNEDAKKVWLGFVEGTGQHLVTAEPIPRLGKFQHHEEPYLNLKFKLKVPMAGLHEAERKGNAVFGLDQFGQNKSVVSSIMQTYLGNEIVNVYPEVIELLSNCRNAFPG
jgi:hypothetical protein